MKKLLIPAMGVAAAFGAAQPAAADVQLAQLMLPGQPGFSGTANRTLPSGSPGISPLNTPTGPSPFTVAPSPSFAQPSPFIGQRGDLNAAEPETAGPAERDANGKLVPSVDRTRARFAGERGADGKLLPTFGTEQAQATTPSQTTPQASPPTPSRSDMPNTTTRRPGSGAAETPAPQGQNQMGTTGATPMPTTRSGTAAQSNTSAQQRQRGTQADRQRSGSMGSSRGQAEEYTTSALNALSAQGYTNFGRMERVGNMYQTTATKDGRQVMVQVDPATGRVTEH